jgi:hypothetical protein
MCNQSMWLLPYLNGPRTDLKFGFSISAFIASFLPVSSLHASYANAPPRGPS